MKKVVALVLLATFSMACDPDPRERSGGVITTYIMENGDTCYRTTSYQGVALSCIRD